MSCWPVSLCPTLVPSHRNLEDNYGKIFGSPILSAREFHTPKELSHLKSWQLNRWRPDGKMRVYPLTTCPLKMHQSLPHARDGLYLLILSCKVPTGFEALKVTIFLPSILTRNIGWENWQRTFLMVELCFLKVSKNKLKPLWILYYPEPLWRRPVTIPLSWVARLLTMTWSSSSILWLSLPILTSDLKLLPSVPSLTSLSLSLV